MAPEILTAAGTVLTTVALIGSLLGWGMRRIDRRFEAVDRRFEAVDRRFDVVEDRMRAFEREQSGFRVDVEREFSEVRVSIARLEGSPPRFVTPRRA